jgi:hypothetical protein
MVSKQTETKFAEAWDIVINKTCISCCKLLAKKLSQDDEKSANMCEDHVSCAKCRLAYFHKRTRFSCKCGRLYRKIEIESLNNQLHNSCAVCYSRLNGDIADECKQCLIQICTNCNLKAEGVCFVCSAKVCCECNAPLGICYVLPPAPCPHALHFNCSDSSGSHTCKLNSSH